MNTWLLVLLIQAAKPGNPIQAIPFGVYQSSLACEDQGLRFKNASVSKRLEYSCWEAADDKKRKNQDE